MTHHEDAHQGRRLIGVGIAVLVVSSGMAAAAAAPPRQVFERRIGTVILLCAPPTSPGPPDCSVIIRTPIR
jgi:hypothetical protein